MFKYVIPNSILILIGFQTIDYNECLMDKTKTEMAASYCAHLPTPPSTKGCFPRACEYEWKALYGACVATCGTGKVASFIIWSRLDKLYDSSHVYSSSDRCIA